MLTIEKWAQGKPPFIALVAPLIAAFAREIPETLKHQKKHRLLFPHLPGSRSSFLACPVPLTPSIWGS